MPGAVCLVASREPAERAADGGSLRGGNFLARTAGAAAAASLGRGAAAPSRAPARGASGTAAALTATRCVAAGGEHERHYDCEPDR